MRPLFWLKAYFLGLTAILSCCPQDYMSAHQNIKVKRMARSQNSFIKKQKEKKRLMKKKEKEERKKERKENNAKGGELSDMIAYVDEFGNITSEPPSEEEPKDQEKK